MLFSYALHLRSSVRIPVLHLVLGDIAVRTEVPMKPAALTFQA